MAHEILIVDDEADIRTQIAGILEDEGYQARVAASGEAALEAVANRLPALVILDVWLAGSAYDGIQLLELLKRDHPALQIVMISGHGTVDMAVNATKKGAYDFIAKPFQTDVLLHTIDRALEDVKLKRENEALKTLTGGAEAELIGVSAAVQDIRKAIERVAPTDSRIMITGPSGVGKSAIARLIHNRSNRRDGPFIVLNCAALDEENFETALFGREPSGDEPRMVGVLEQAHMGTLLLDEVADMPDPVQGKIVRVLHSQRFQRVGGGNWVDVDVRVLSSSNRDLNESMRGGRFREDLYYRLNVVPLEVAPLSERRDDVPPLADHLIKRSATAKGRAPITLTADAVTALQAHDWPGNVWELANVAERLLLSGTSDTPVQADAVLRAIGEDGADVLRWERAQEVMNQPLREAREDFEREYLLFHLTRFGGNISRTAEFVEMDRAALHRKLKGLGVQNVMRAGKE